MVREFSGGVRIKRDFATREDVTFTIFPLRRENM